MGSVPFEILNAEARTLRGDLHLPETGDTFPAVIVCHGFKGFKDWGFFPELGQRLTRAGFASVLFNFSGAGVGPDLLTFTDFTAFAEDTISRQVADLGCIVDALHAGMVGDGRLDVQRLAVVGHSRGGAVAILRAREDRRLVAVASWAGVSRLWRYSAREVQEWRDKGAMEFLNMRTMQRMRIGSGYLDDLEANRARFDLVAAVQALAVPLLLVHGNEDLSVPEDEARELHAAAAGRADLHVIGAAGHTFGVVHPWAGSTPAFDEATRVTIDWLHARFRGAA